MTCRRAFRWLGRDLEPGDPVDPEPRIHQRWWLISKGFAESPHGIHEVLRRRAKPSLYLRENPENTPKRGETQGNSGKPTETATKPRNTRKRVAKGRRERDGGGNTSKPPDGDTITHPAARNPNDTATGAH